jgi:coenzyme PQQ precursor peptide PqqA
MGLSAERNVRREKGGFRTFCVERRINEGVVELTCACPLNGARKPEEGTTRMVWSTPEVREVCVGMEVTSYLSAEM